MSANTCGAHGEARPSALSGTGDREGGSRANALWGKGGRGLIAILGVLFITASDALTANGVTWEDAAEGREQGPRPGPRAYA
jgi:hypothetical protein